MATRALDIVTIMHAFSVLNGELGIAKWQAHNPEQEKIFTWLDEHQKLLAEITGLSAKASRFWRELNEFLVSLKFEPMFQPFPPDLGIGVASVLDKLVLWKSGPGAKVQIRTIQGERPGFELPPTDVNVFQVEGYSESYLLQLLTKSQDTLWLFTHPDTSIAGLDMVRLSMDVMAKPHKVPMRLPLHSRGGQYPAFAGAQVMMLDFFVKPDISWLLGAETDPSGPYYFIAQAFQQFKMRMDETGARVKVVTGAVSLRGTREEPAVFVLDKPFYGWWMQEGIPLPMAPFYADWDCLHRPGGSLEEL